MTVNTALSVSDKQRLDGSALADERKDEGKRLARSTLLLIRTSSLHGCCWLFFFFTVACIHTRRLPTTTNTDRSLCDSLLCRPAKFDASALSFVSPFKRKKKEAHRGRHRFLPSILARDSRCWTGLRFPMNLAQVIVSASFFFLFCYFDRLFCCRRKVKQYRSSTSRDGLEKREKRVLQNILEKEGQHISKLAKK